MERTTMFNLLNKRLTEEQIIKITTDYDNKFNELERKNEIKDKYLQLIIDLGFDYDGFATVESLKNLIDELVYYARLAKRNDDKEIIYSDDTNILGEKIN